MINFNLYNDNYSVRLAIWSYDMWNW